MSRSLRRVPLLLVLVSLVAASPGEKGSPSAADSERNRELLKKWKADPEHYARLQRDLRDFWALSKAERQRLRHLDREVHALDEKTEKRLWKAIERYAAWLEKLPPEDRQHIEQAKDTTERLRLIKEIHEHQWVEKLPSSLRDELAKLTPRERSAQVAQLRQQERQQRQLWQRSLLPDKNPPQRPGKPKTHLHDFSRDYQLFVQTHVLTKLSADELKEYRKAEGTAEFASTVRRLAAFHPVLPPLQRPITRFGELPAKAKELAGGKAAWERRTEVWHRLRQVEGKWPEWALTFHAFLPPRIREQIPALGASRPHEFPKEVSTFLRDKLAPKLDKGEAKSLHELEGKWPEYPRRLLELAAKHRLDVPGMSLPEHAGK